MFVSNKQFVNLQNEYKEKNFVILDNFLTKKCLQEYEKNISDIKIWNDPNNGFLERQQKENKDLYEKHEKYEKGYNPTNNRTVADLDEVRNKLSNTIKIFESKNFINFIEKLTCLDDLFINFRGGGLQKSENKAYLKIHLDNNWNPKTNSYPILNCILFLSEWSSNYGGDLQLWSFGKKHTIFPKINRLVIRKNSEDSYHGFPEPINCPPHVSRVALVVFYHTKKIVPHQKRSSALWM